MIPSRKIIPILLACVIAIAGIIYAKQAGQRSVASDETLGALVAAPEADISTTTIAELLSFNADDEGNFSDEPLSETVTANLSRDMFASFIFAKDQGLSLNANNIEALAQSATAQSKSVVTGKKVYQVSDFKIIKSSSDMVLVDLTNYGLAVRQAINTPTGPVVINEVDILTKAATNNSSEGLEKVDIAIAGYRTVVNRLLNISVPAVALLVHFDFVNSFNNIANDLEQMRMFGNDSAIAIVGLNAYAGDIDYLKQAGVNFVLLMEQYGVDFSAQ